MREHEKRSDLKVKEGGHSVYDKPIGLEEFTEAVSRGVMRALDARKEERALDARREDTEVGQPEERTPRIFIGLIIGDTKVGVDV